MHLNDEVEALMVHALEELGDGAQIGFALRQSRKARKLDEAVEIGGKSAGEFGRPRKPNQADAPMRPTTLQSACRRHRAQEVAQLKRPEEPDCSDVVATWPGSGVGKAARHKYAPRRQFPIFESSGTKASGVPLIRKNGKSLQFSKKGDKALRTLPHVFQRLKDLRQIRKSAPAPRPSGSAYTIRVA